MKSLIHFLAIVATVTAAARGQDEPIKPATIARNSPVDFNDDILPIFRNNCLACHNSSTNENDLILETAASTIKGGVEGAGIIPGKPDESLVYLVAARSAEPVMPPLPNDVKAEAFTPEELGLLRQWIVEGAKASSSTTNKIAWKPINPRLKAVYSVAFDELSGTVAASRANTISIYDLHRRKELDRLVDPQLGAPARAHLDVVQSLAISPDGNTLASGGYRVVKLWRRTSFAEQVKLSSNIEYFVIANDGQIVAATDKNAVEVYASLGSEPKQITTHAAPITALAFASDGSLLSGDKSGLVKRCKLDGQAVGSNQLPTGVTSIASNDQFMVAGLPDGRIIAFSPDLKSQVTELTPHAGEVTGLATGPQPHTVVSSGSDGTIVVSDLKAKKTIRTLKADSAVTRILTSPDRKLVAAITDSGKACVWQVADGKLVCECKTDQAFIAMQAEHNRKIKITDRRHNHRAAQAKAAATEVDTQAKALKAANETKGKADKQLADATKKQTDEAAKVNAAKKLLAEKPEDKTVAQQLAALEKSRQKSVDAFQKATKAVAAAAQDVQIVTQSLERSKKTLEERQKQQKVEDGIRKQLREGLKTQKAKPLAKTLAAYFDSNNCLVTLHSDGTRRKWNSLTGTPLSTAVAGNMSGNRVVSNTNATIVQVDATTFKSIATRWKLHATIGADSIVDRATAIDFSPDGKQLAVGSGQPSRSGQLLIFDVDTGMKSRDFANAHSDTVLDVQFSPDGTHLLSCGADKFAHAWDALAGKHVRSYEGHTHHVLTASWQPDMTQVVTGGADNLIKVWDAETGEQKRTIRTFRKHVTRLRFAGSADTFFASSGDRTVRGFTASNGRATRNFGGSSEFVHTLDATGSESVVVAGGEDGVVRLWNARDSKQITSFAPSP